MTESLIPENVIQIRGQDGPQRQFLRCSADICFFGGSAGGGKQLSLETSLPTPTGWIKLRDLAVGDLLFDEKGKICQVTALHPVSIPNVAYRFYFDDGSTIECCSEHLWLTYSAKELNSLTRLTDEWRAARRLRRESRISGNKSIKFTASLVERNKNNPPSILLSPQGTVRTAQEIVETLTLATGRANHAIPVAASLELPEMILPIDPYLVGLWLGDGRTISGSITIADVELVDQLVCVGAQTRKIPSDKYTYRIDGLTVKLRTIGLLGDKHIPPQYLRASSNQRLALLQGLMDSDGYARERGRGVEFTNTNKKLAGEVVELVRSLGIKARIREGKAVLNGRVIGPKYRINWSTDIPMFRLPRKLTRQMDGKKLRRTLKFRYIVKAERIVPSPMRCLEVSSSSRLFLAGESMIPTHNSVALILDAVRNVEVPGYEAALFRRTVPELTQPGGLWTRTQDIYRFVPGARPRENTHEWIFPTGATIRLSHMQHDSDRWNWYGSELAFIGFDELITFSEIQFWFLVSRNRTTCGVRPYVRGTTNPDPDAWVRSFIDWWIGEDGYAIPERSGVIRWFIRYNEQIHWFDSRVAAVKFAIAVAEPGQDPQQPMSFTFIASSVYDNPALLSKDPGYLSKLQSMPRVDRLRLLGEGKKGGNWNVRDAAGLVFSRGNFHIIDAMPMRIRRIVRYWDKAGTEGGGKFSAGVKIAQVEDFRYPFVVMDVVRGQWGSRNREATIRMTAELDGPEVEVYIEQEPGSGGKESSENTILNLAGFPVYADRVTGAKSIRTKPYAAQSQAGNVALLRGAWNEPFVHEHDNYDPAKADKGTIVVDQVDAASGAFNKLALGGSIFADLAPVSPLPAQPAEDTPRFSTDDELRKLQTDLIAQQMRSLYRR